jgi:hypothetical protein
MAFTLTSPGAVLLARGAVIERRPETTLIEGASVPLLVYRHSGLGAWASGVDVPVGDPRPTERIDQVVDAALEFLHSTGRVELIDGESLDVLFFTTTYGTSLPADGGTPTSIRLQTRVTFGHRYRGLPIWGAHLRVMVDVQGRIVDADKAWRDIEPATGDVPPMIQLISPQELEARRNPDWVAGLPLTSQPCGYFESDRADTPPGVGCLYVYYDASAGGEMLAPEQRELINLSVSGEPPLPAVYYP